MVTREEVAALRAQAQREGWLCRRCGAEVWAHQRGFECLDGGTRAIRKLRARGYR